ncbi:hypothetical protein L211DRAFT_849720 [Terfezia boudieri ATCC MYA-4762]|uniref:Uncharacterized protein n=1 Tax=Terfezia boudieri ATCC MYA-4762 TaxID=1051890 RepID=A0A3N4LKJ3_9PEZI|nr:hypothetical protein L211DRAFT_849720 [Terfezia boudieri ATCC MYA-4762]
MNTRSTSSKPLHGDEVWLDQLKWFVGGQSKWNWRMFGTTMLTTSTSPLAPLPSGIPPAPTAYPNCRPHRRLHLYWHLGVLRLPNRSSGTSDPAAEDWYFSGVYIEPARSPPP